MFLYFAYRSWRDGEDAHDTEETIATAAHGVVVTSFLMIFLAELGDKTQLARVGLVALMQAVLWTELAVG